MNDLNKIQHKLSLTALIDGLIRVISTVIIYIAFPALRDAATVPALELAGTACSTGAV